MACDYLSMLGLKIWKIWAITNDVLTTVSTEVVKLFDHYHGDEIRDQRSWSSLVQVMVCVSMLTSDPKLNQCLPIIKEPSRIIPNGMSLNT